MHKPTYSPYFERGQRRASLEIDHFEDFEGFEGSDCEVATDNDAASQWPPPGLGLWTPAVTPKPTVSRESFWNHSMKKWSDMSSLFILNDNIICFIAFLDVFSTKNGYQKHTHKKSDSRIPPPPYLGLSTKKKHLLWLPLVS